MNGKDLFLGMNYVSDQYVKEAETVTKFERVRSIRSLRRPALAAALIAVMLLLAGCGVAYAVSYLLSIQELKVGQRQETYDVFSDNGLQYLGKETATNDVLTLAGIQGTPGYQAAKEWFDFKQSYDPDHTLYWELDKANALKVFSSAYGGYGLYTQEMKDALDEIAGKYGLKLRGSRVSFKTSTLLFKALGMENILTSGSQAQMKIIQADYFENGNLDVMFDIQIPGEEGTENTWVVLYYRPKDCLIADTAEIDSAADWKEWNYTTASGKNVLILRSPSSCLAWILCDMTDCTASLRIEARHEYLSDTGIDHVEEMTDRQLELLADAVNFSIEPKLTQGYENLSDGAKAVGEEINGCRIDLKSAFTDGYAAYVVLGITAPEGVNLTGSDISVGPGNRGSGFFEPDTAAVSGGMSSGCQEDQDGLPNTCDYVIRANYQERDGQMPFPEGSVWNIYWENLVLNRYDPNTGENEETTLAEGAWSFDVRFEDGDYRELELLSQPMMINASIGWSLDGSEVIEELEVTSIKLRSMSVSLSCENRYADFFTVTGVNSYVVMKDGSQIKIVGNRFTQPIDLEQADYLLLAGGTKLTIPQPPASTAE